jgi:hypothetical protein
VATAVGGSDRLQGHLLLGLDGRGGWGGLVRRQAQLALHEGDGVLGAGAPTYGTGQLAAPDRRQNQSRVVVLEHLDPSDVGRAKALLRPYLEDVRTAPAPAGREMAPFTDNAVEVVLSRADGKPREILRSAHALIEHGSIRNWDYIDAERAADVLDSLEPRDEYAASPSSTAEVQAPGEEIWKY